MILSLLLSTSAAFGHAGAPVDSIDVILQPGDDVALGLEASIGFLWNADGEHFDWLCHEAVTAPDAVLTPRYAVSADGVMLSWMPSLEQVREEGETLLRSPDGCDWSPAQGLSGQVVRGAAFDPADADLVLVATGNPDGTGAILRSTDAGATFTPTPLTFDDQRVSSLVFGAEGVAWAASYTGDSGLWIHRSTDGGETWSSLEVAHTPLEDRPLKLSVAAAHPSDPDVAWVIIDDLAVDTLARIDWEAQTSTPLLAPEGYLTDVAMDHTGALWAGVMGSGFVRAADGETFELVDTPPGLGVEAGRDQLYLSTRFELTNQSMYVGTYEEGFEPAYTFYELDGTASCPAESDVGRACAEAWPLLAMQLGVDEDTGLPEDTGTPEDDPDTAGCRTAPSPGGAMALLLPLFGLGIARRRTR